VPETEYQDQKVRLSDEEKAEAVDTPYLTSQPKEKYCFCCSKTVYWIFYAMFTGFAIGTGSFIYAINFGHLGLRGPGV
jgi:hypothetical protein